MSEISIIHVVGRSRYGGGVQVILPLALAAKEQGWRVHILASDPMFQEEIRANGIEVVELDLVRREINPYYDLRDTATLFRLFRKQRYSMVHTHTSKGGAIGRFAASLARVPVVVHTVHGFAFDEDSRRAQRIAYGAVERTAANWCDSIVTVSKYHRDFALREKICAPEKIVAIPNGLAPDRIKAQRSREAVRKEFALAPEELMVLSPVRIAATKGLEYLVRCVGDLRKKLNRPFRVFIAGDGTLRASLEQLSRELKADSHLTFLGFRSDLGDLLAASDIVVLPTLLEGLSISLLEAMAAGKPIVTTSIPSNVEVVGPAEAAVLTPPRDPSSLAEAIVRIGKDPALAATLGRRAHDVFRREYTRQRMTDSYIDLYRKLLQRKAVLQSKEMVAPWPSRVS